MLPHLARYLVCTALLTGLCKAADVPVSQVGDGVKFTEVARKSFNLGDHKLTVIRVRRPNLPLLPTPSAPPPLTADQQATSDRLAKKSYVSLNLSVIVYLGSPTVTELRWHDDAGTQEYRAWSNADFRYLAQVPFIETEATVYQLQPLMFLEAYAPTDFPAGQKPPIPDGLGLSTTEAEYVVDSSGKDWPSQETTLTGLDYLHAYYQLHYADLKASCEKAQADSDAREKELREHPPVKPDTTLRFWPIQSRINPR
jgi:hypothetical protein